MRPRAAASAALTSLICLAFCKPWQLERVCQRAPEAGALHSVGSPSLLAAACLPAAAPPAGAFSAPRAGLPASCGSPWRPLPSAPPAGAFSAACWRQAGQALISTLTCTTIGERREARSAPIAGSQGVRGAKEPGDGRS